jgi:hypothetical protein
LDAAVTAERNAELSLCPALLKDKGDERKSDHS